jgi:hypothetical protein
MLTFLHSLIALLSAAILARTAARTRTFLLSSRAFAVALLLSAFIMAASAQGWRQNDSLRGATPARKSSPARVDRKRLLMLRHNESAEGSRLTFTSDSPLDDYKSYVEGERFFVLLPQCALVAAAGATGRGDARGRGFAEMRVEQRNDEVLLSFRLQQGATVSINQNFNRLDVVFMTNERANPVS